MVDQPTQTQTTDPLQLSDTDKARIWHDKFGAYDANRAVSISRNTVIQIADELAKKALNARAIWQDEGRSPRERQIAKGRYYAMDEAGKIVRSMPHG